MRGRAGKYCRKIAVYSRNLSANSAGDLETASLTKLCERFASVKSGAGVEKNRSLDQQQSLSTVTFAIPFDSVAATITPAMQIQYAGRTFEIVSVEDMDELHEEIQIIATEQT